MKPKSIYRRHDIATGGGGGGINRQNLCRARAACARHQCKPNVIFVQCKPNAILSIVSRAQTKASHHNTVGHCSGARSKQPYQRQNRRTTFKRAI